MSLKELRIHVDGSERISLCKHQMDDTNSLKVIDIRMKNCGWMFPSQELYNLTTIMVQNQIISNPFPKIVNCAGRKVNLPVPLDQNKRFPDLSTYFVESPTY